MIIKKALNYLIYVISFGFGISLWIYLSYDAYQSNIATDFYGVSYLSLILWNFGLRSLLLSIYFLLLFKTIFFVLDLKISQLNFILPIFGSIIAIQLVPNDMNAIIHHGIMGLFSLSIFWAFFILLIWYFWLSLRRNSGTDTM